MDFIDETRGAKRKEKSDDKPSSKDNKPGRGGANKKDQKDQEGKPNGKRYCTHCKMDGHTKPFCGKLKEELKGKEKAKANHAKTNPPRVGGAPDPATSQDGDSHRHYGRMLGEFSVFAGLEREYYERLAEQLAKDLPPLKPEIPAFLSPLDSFGEPLEPLRPTEPLEPPSPLKPM